MRVLLFLLLAVSTPAVHHAPKAKSIATASPHPTFSPSPEERAAVAETATAYWTKILAGATFALAFVTVSVTTVDLFVANIQRRQDRRERLAERDADAATRALEREAEENASLDTRREQMLNALSELEQILWFFNRRCDQLKKNSALDADVLMRGFDAAMERALSTELIAALSQELTEQVYVSIFSTHDAFALGVATQRSPSGHTSNGTIQPNANVQLHANAAESLTAKAAQLVRERLETLKDEWFPE